MDRYLTALESDPSYQLPVMFLVSHQLNMATRLVQWTNLLRLISGRAQGHLTSVGLLLCFPRDLSSLLLHFLQIHIVQKVVIGLDHELTVLQDLWI